MATKNDTHSAHTMIRLASSPDIFNDEEVALQKLKNAFEHAVKGPMAMRYPGQFYEHVQLSHAYPGNRRSGHISADLFPVNPQNDTKETWNYLALNGKPHYFTNDDVRFELLLAFLLVLSRRHGVRFEIRSTVKTHVKERALEAARLMCPDLVEPAWLPVSELIDRPADLDFRA